MSIGVMFIAASRSQPGVMKITLWPSVGPTAPALLGTGSRLSARVSQGFGIPHILGRCVLHGDRPR